MRALFLALLFANLALYAWWRYGVPENAAPAPLSRQIAPDKLKVVAPANLPPVSATKPPPSPPVPAPAAAAACLEWGSFTVADAPRAEQALESLGLGARVAQRRSEEQAGWWVFIPPQANRQSALRKAAELKELGVEDYFVVQEDGAFRWALSLGVFRTEEAAQARLAVVRGQGVRTARVGVRETVVPKVWLQVKGVDAPLQLRLKEIARQVEGSELKDCP
ncbi:MAG TPA: SPOR domain-containing protein [Burkholderiales bacterium]|nr:SPOR domain-containing protein [Burkholderiales bacterium]